MNNFKRLSAVILVLCTATTIFVSCSNNPKNNDVSSTAETFVITEIITEKETVTVEVTDEKGEVSVSVSEKTITIPVTKTVTKNEIKKTENKINTITNNSVEDQIQSVPNQASSAANQITTVDLTKIRSETSAPQKPVSTTQSKDAVLITTTQKAQITSAPIINTVATTKKPVVDDKIDEKSVGIFMLSKTDPVRIGSQANVIVQGEPGKTYSIYFYETPSTPIQLEDKKSDTNGFVTWTFDVTNSCNLGKRKLVVKENGSNNYVETSITIK